MRTDDHLKNEHTSVPDDDIEITVEAEENVFSDCYSNNGAGPMWCLSNTCIVRQDSEVFVSATERLPQYQPLNDCRWVLLQRITEGWVRQQADQKDRQREPCPLGCLSSNRIILSSNPTMLGAKDSGGGPARPELLLIDAMNPTSLYSRLIPQWQGQPPFTEHSYRTMAVDSINDEVILFQNANYSHSEWALLDAEGHCLTGRLCWPPHTLTDLAPFGASHMRVNYPNVVLRNRTVHYCGVAAYDNWDRVRTVKDLGLGTDPNRSGASGMAGRQRGNRFRRLLYTCTDDIGKQSFCDWIEIDNTFDDGGSLFPGDMYLDETGTVHMLWSRAPMLRTLRDAHYPDIQRIYSIEYAALLNGKVVQRQTLVRAGEGIDMAILTDADREGWPYVLDNGERILGDPIATPRFHITPDERLLVAYYVSGRAVNGAPLSENRILEVYPDGTTSKPVTIPMEYPLTQFFTAAPRFGCAPSYTLDLLGHRRGDWHPREGSDNREYEGTISHACIQVQATLDSAPQGLPHSREL